MSPALIESVLFIVCLLIILGFVFVIGYIIYLRRKSRNNFLQEMEDLKIIFKNEMLQSELEMQEHTFETISMEIHDNVSQLLSVSKLNLGMIEDASPEVLEKIRYSGDLITHAINDLKDLSRKLDSDRVRQEGLHIAIEEYIVHLRKSLTFDIIFKSSGKPLTIPVEKELILFRILQESMNNILKHAEASLIVIEIIYNSPASLRLEITDNGKGFMISENPYNLNEGSGIRNMQKRASMIGGNFSLESSTGRGARVRIQLPLTQNDGIQRIDRKNLLF
jgi:two-component system NarL family sensor kinase